jgi:ribosome-associated protein
MVENIIPIKEIKVSFARSSGAGGQNVNKTSTKATVRWRVGDSNVLNEFEKERIRKKLGNRINSEDELIVISETERSQLRNRELAIFRLQALVGRALVVPKFRRSTRPTKASKLRRIESKKIRSQVKAGRRTIK